MSQTMEQIKRNTKPCMKKRSSANGIYSLEGTSFRPVYSCSWLCLLRHMTTEATRMTKRPPLTTAETTLQSLPVVLLVLVVTVKQSRDQ